MRFGQTFALKTAGGKLGVGAALVLFGVIAILAAPSLMDKLICTLVVFAGAAFIALGIRQDRREKRAFRQNGGKEEKH